MFPSSTEAARRASDAEPSATGSPQPPSGASAPASAMHEVANVLTCQTPPMHVAERFAPFPVVQSYWHWVWAPTLHGEPPQLELSSGTVVGHVTT